jgi:hypothetical protein
VPGRCRAARRRGSGALAPTRKVAIGSKDSVSKRRSCSRAMPRWGARPWGGASLHARPGCMRLPLVRAAREPGRTNPRALPPKRAQIHLTGADSGA